MKKKGVGAFVFHELTRVDAVMYVEHTHRYAVLQAGAAATWATTRQPTRGTGYTSLLMVTPIWPVAERFLTPIQGQREIRMASEQ